MLKFLSLSVALYQVLLPAYAKCLKAPFYYKNNVNIFYAFYNVS